MTPIKQLAIIFNPDKSGSEELARSIAEAAKSLSVTSSIASIEAIPEDFLAEAGACCTIGGDGTILASIPQSLKYQTPVFGVNLGKLGFLATYNPDSILEDLPKILGGDYDIFNRAVLECSNANEQTHYALNDVVIKNLASVRMMELSVEADEEFVTSYSCDGLIIATPTGSTAYNLSAGGPIVYPGANVITMTPICPHTLTNRSVIFSKNRKLRIDLPSSNPADTQVSLDGQIPWNNERDFFPISVFISNRTIPLLQPTTYSHFRILRNKLQWGKE